MTQNLFANFHTEMRKEVKVVNNLPASASVREAGLICGLERSPGKGNSNPLQCSCLENPMDRGAWWATVPGVGKSRT